MDFNTFYNGFMFYPGIEDFLFTSEKSGLTITLNIGDQSTIIRNISILILPDGRIEADEFFAIYLQVISPLTSVVDYTTATITILSEDGEIWGVVFHR